MTRVVVSMFCFRFAHIDGTIPGDPAVYVRLPKFNRDESRTQGLDRLELIRFLQVAQTITAHHGALAYLLGINALRASKATAARIEDYTHVPRGHRALHLIGKDNKPPTMPHLSPGVGLRPVPARDRLLHGCPVQVPNLAAVHVFRTAPRPSIFDQA